MPRTQLERMIVGCGLAMTALLVALLIPAWLEYRQSQRLAREPDEVAAIAQNGLERGTTQTAAMVNRSGLVWGGQTFDDKARLARWLAAHGSSIRWFTNQHAEAVRGLPTRVQRRSKTPAR